MSNGNGKNTLYCNDCKVRFTLYARRTKRKYFCPVCGECIAVVKYTERDQTNMIQRKTWTTKEEAKLRRLLDKGFRPRELTTRFDRTEWSLKKKANRLGYFFD